MIIRRFTSILFFIALIAGCNSYDFSRHIIQQGNLLPRSKIAQLKVGMSKKEVAILMGTSLLSPLFNNNRWDYAFTWRKGNGPMEKRYVTLFFKNDRLVRIFHCP